MTYRRIIAAAFAGLLLTPCTGTAADDGATATYLANEGVMIDRGETKILFDPLFDNGFGQYELLPDALQVALFAGKAPFEDVDAVFVSHAHGDHFSADLMLDYLRAQPDVVLYAPMQAVTALRGVAGSSDAKLFDRVTGLDLDIGDAGAEFELDGIRIDAVRVPHSGWPERMTDIENLVFRVTLNDAFTVLHMGDAADSPPHFAAQRTFWRNRDNTLALPPYWFFLTEAGNNILRTELEAGRSIGIHVPEQIPDSPSERPQELQSFELFTRPGETRDVGAP